MPLFAGVPGRHLRRIAALGSAVSFDAKTRIVSAGDPGDAFYVLLVGRAEVQRGRGRPNVEIGPGAYFGELALLDGAPRSATVVATSGDDMSDARPQAVREDAQGRARCRVRASSHARCPAARTRCLSGLLTHSFASA